MVYTEKTAELRPLTPEQKRAMKVLVNALYVSERYMVTSIPKDGMLPTDYIAFSHRAIKKYMVWCDEWWSWNQSNAKSYAHIDRDTFVTIRKLNPRKNKGVPSNLKKPAYKIWIFHVEFSNSPPCWCLWCERGVSSQAAPAAFHLPILVAAGTPSKPATLTPHSPGAAYFTTSAPVKQQQHQHQHNQRQQEQEQRQQQASCGSQSASMDSMEWSSSVAGWESYFASLPATPAPEPLLGALEQRESCLMSLFQDDVEMLLWAGDGSN